MQNNKKGNFKDILNQDISIWDKIVTSTRDCYYLIIFLLLREEEISLYIASGFTVIEFFQLFFFYFHPTNYTIWKAGNLPLSLGTFFGYFHITQYVYNTTWSTYIIVFYVIFLVNIIFLLLFLYIQHLHSNNMHYSSYLIYIIHQYVQLISTILYMPLLYFFAGILYCQNGFLNYFPDIECWAGLHLLHAFFAILSSILLAIFVLAVVKTYFRSESSTIDPTAKTGGKANFDLQSYKLITVISFTFFGGSEFLLIIFVIMLGCSVVVFLHFYNNSPYYNIKFSLLYQVMSSINLWTIITLILAYLAEGPYLDGTIIVYFIGIPFIIAFILSKRDIKIDRLLANVNKFQTGEEIMFQVSYLQKLIGGYNTNKDQAAILDGYIELHKLKCAKCKNSDKKKDKIDDKKEECVMEDQTQQKNIRILKTIMVNSSQQNVKHAKLIHLIYETYMLGVKRFPNNTNLRISYSLFLIEKLKYRQQALQELNYAEENSPPFDIFFMIYRHRKLIEEEIQKEKKNIKNQDDQLDIISELRYQKAFQVLHQQIEQSALAHMDFWSSLVEDTPDMQKMKISGEKINTSQDIVEQCWKKLTTICDFKIESIVFYAKYLSDIRQDKDKADVLYQKCNNLKYHNFYRGPPKNSKKGNEEEKDVEMLEAIPTITISLENEKLGQIIYSSQGVGNIFGFTKNELVNKKIQDIIPQMYAVRHDEFLENYLARNEFKYFLDEKTIYGKTKARYITPIAMSLKQQESIVHGLLIVGTLKIEKQAFKPLSHMLVSNDLVIDSFSSSTINILDFDIKSLPNISKDLNLLKMFPNILEQDFQKGKHKNFTHTDISFISSWPLPAQLRKNKMQIKSSIEELFLSFPENEPEQIGYLVKFEKSYLNQENNFEKQKSGSLLNPNLTQLPKHNSFQFQYNFGQFGPQGEKTVIIGGFTLQSFITDNFSQNLTNFSDGNNSIELKKPPSIRPDNTNDAIHLDSQQHKGYDQQSNNQKLDQIGSDIPDEDYSIGYKIVRLYQGRLIQLEDFENEEEEQKKKEKQDEQNNEDSIFKQNNIINDAGDVKMSHNFNVVITNRSKLNELIQNKNIPKPIIIITRMIFILLFFLMAISFIEFFYLKSQYDSISLAYTLIQKSNYRMGDLQRLQSQVRDILLIQDGITEIQEDSLRRQKQSSIQQNIQQIIQEINDINTFLSLNYINLLPEHQNLLNTACIKLYYSYDLTELHGLNDATEQILTSTLDIMNQLNTQLESQKKNIFFVEYNLFNDYYISMNQANDYYIYELELITQQSYPILFSLLIITPVLIVFVLVNMLPILINVNKQGDNILSMFLEIQTKNVQKLYEQTEKFIQDMRKDTDDNNSVGEYEKEDGDDADEKQGLVKLRKKKKFINRVQNNIHIILFKLFIGMSILEVSFLFNFFRSQNQLQDTKILLSELKSIVSFDSVYALADNIEKQIFFNNDTKFLINNQIPIDSLLNNIHDLYALDTMILQQHSQNIEIHSQTFNDVFKLLMNQNPCQLFQDMKITNNQAECEQYADGSVMHGMSVVSTHYFENIRLILTYYKKIQQFENISFQDEFQQPPLQIVNNTQQNYYYNLLLLPISKENEVLLSKFIQTTSRYLTEQFILSRNDIIQTEITQRIIIFIAFLLLIVLIYTFFWLPIIDDLVNQNYRNRKLLEIIPLEIIVVMRQARSYLRQLYEQVSKLQIKQDQKMQEVNQKRK